MAKSKTPAKRTRQAEENRLENAMQKNKLRTAIKKYRGTVATENPAAAGESLGTVISLIDKNVGKGLMHKNTAARKKSQLTKQYNNLVKQAADKSGL